MINYNELQRAAHDRGQFLRQCGEYPAQSSIPPSDDTDLEIVPLVDVWFTVPKSRNGIVKYRVVNAPNGTAAAVGSSGSHW
jgi:hypothetical protein